MPSHFLDLLLLIPVTATMVMDTVMVMDMGTTAMDIMDTMAREMLKL